MPRGFCGSGLDTQGEKRASPVLAHWPGGSRSAHSTPSSFTQASSPKSKGPGYEDEDSEINNSGTVAPNTVVSVDDGSPPTSSVATPAPTPASTSGKENVTRPRMAAQPILGRSKKRLVASGIIFQK
ncbi:hypothetical protein PCANC_28064 [Puccinia coronata f. sp. avenae]|uniref:Uncharacterized protein n=1 Tax=Puccinia coronata f. sp. avenae TaxID=200324 RepID=A0A2N5TJN5_9BASI|nr:hypothetical protein PCANC_28064 [Puccinia coronata f. sp. avenae]